MYVKTTVKKASGRFLEHGVWWSPYVDRASMQLDCIRAGGKWLNKSTGEMAGSGLFYHFKTFQELMWPDKIWQKGPFVNYWAEKCLETFINYSYIGVLGCAACVDGTTRILNPITGEQPAISDLCKNRVRPTVMTTLGPIVAGVPFVKGIAQLYEVVTKSGRRFTATLDHEVLLTTGVFCRVSDLRCGDSILVADPDLEGSTWEHAPSTHALDGLRSCEIEKDSQSDYQVCSYSHDAQLLNASAVCQDASTLQTDVHKCNHSSSCLDVPNHEPEHIHPYLSCDHPSSNNVFPHNSPLRNGGLLRAFSEKVEHSVRPLQPLELSLLWNNLKHSFSEPGQHFFHTQNLLFSQSKLWVALDVVSSIQDVGFKEFYDLEVPVAHHYYAEGFIHHNSGKSDSYATLALTDWYAHSDCMSVLISSTDLKSLELRIWGMVKKYHKFARARRDWIPGHLIEGKQMIIKDDRQEFEQGRDFKSGLIAIPCRRGNQFVGLQSYIGIHNKFVTLIADEANLMPRAFLDSTSNLAKCERFKLVGLGNPNETTNAHGAICEPCTELGGWEGGIDQSPGTKTWKTRFPNGIALQLPGSDSPNLKAGDNEDVPFPFLITRKQMEDDASIWSKSDWHYQMFVDAKMPRGQGTHRIITRQECEKNGATLEPFWRDSNITKIASLDAAYRGAGGDRCVFTEIHFGRESESTAALMNQDGIVAQKSNVPQGRQILALVDQVVIPIDAGLKAETPESQIVTFVKAQCENRGIPPANFFFDAGMRTSLVQQFSRDWSLDVQSIDCGASPTEQPVSLEIRMPCKDYYKKLVTELWFSVRLVVISKQFRNMSKDVMWELCAREWKTTSGNKIEVETKDEMRQKTGKSPDLADSLAQAILGARQRGFQIAKLIPPKPEKKQGRDWRDELREKSKKIWQTGQLEHASG